MKQRIKQVERLVNLITDADPHFVSLVDHGANQTPFAVLKRIADDDAANTTNEDDDMPRNSAVRKMTFAAKTFPTTKSVEEWLAKNNYSGYELTQEDGYVSASVKGLTDENFRDVRATGVTKGIVAYVGELIIKEDEKAEEGDAKTDETKAAAATVADPVVATKSDEPTLATKYDYWGAYLSREPDVAGVIKDGMVDGLPPGMYEIMDATMKAMGNAFTSAEVSDKREQATKIGEQFAGLTVDVWEVFQKWAASGDEAQKAAAQKFAASFAMPARTPEVKAEPVVEPVVEPAAKTDAVVGITELKAEAFDHAPMAEAIAKALGQTFANALVPVTAALAEISKSASATKESVDALSRKTDDAHTASKDAVNAVRDVAERVGKIEHAAPTSKAAPVDASTSVTEKAETQDETFTRRVNKNIFGR